VDDYHFQRFGCGSSAYDAIQVAISKAGSNQRSEKLLEEVNQKLDRAAKAAEEQAGALGELLDKLPSPTTFGRRDF
jgi:hypothetical protein